MVCGGGVSGVTLKLTYTHDETLLNQSRQLAHTAVRVLPGTTTPEHARLVVCGHVDGLEGDAVGS